MSADKSLVDPAFEYNAPQFVDFTTPLEDDDAVDEYFNYDHESGVPVIPDQFEESENDDSAIYATPRQNVGSSTPGSVRRSSRLAKSPTDQDKTPKARQAPTAGTPNGLPQRVLTPKNVHQPQRILTPKDNNCQPQRVLKPKNNTPQAERVLTPKRSKRYSEPITPKQKENAEVSTKPKVPSNLCTSPSEWKRRAGKQSTVQPAEEKKPALRRAQSMRQKNSNRRSVPNVRSELSVKDQQNKKPDADSAATQSDISTDRQTRTMSKDRKRSLNTSAARSTNTSVDSARARTRSRNRSLNRSVDLGTRIRTRSASNKTLSPGKKTAPTIKPKLTLPTTPTFMKRKSVQESNKELKSTEDRELEKIEELRKELEAKRKLAEESYKSSKNATGYVPPHSKQPLTKPDKIHFATDNRIKSSNENKADSKEVNFTKILRQNRLRTAAQPLKPTVPHPFHLHDRKRKMDEPSVKYMSMAEVEKSVFGKTPDRYRTKPNNRGPSPAKKRRSSGDSKGKPELTIPKTPSLQTRSRKRDHHIVSQAELDEIELEEIKKHKFKAHPVNEKVLKNAHLGVKKVQPKELTRPVGFELETYKRTDVWASHRPEDEEPEPFHARPVPTDMLKGPTGVKPKKEIPITVPASPAFALKNRVRPQRKPSLPQPEDVKKLMKEHKVPHTGIPFQPKIEHRITEPQPFSFDSRDRKMMSDKERKIQRALEEEKRAREFHANPLPDLSPETLPRKKVKSPTRPEPFNLEIDGRGAKKAEEWRQKVQESLTKEREMHQFKAQPAEVVHKQPFIPKKSTKPLTDIGDVELSTERRCEERAEFEKWRKDHEQQQALAKLAAERAEREREEEMYKQMRVDANVKANPIRKYKNVQIQPSVKPLTNPVTPRFSNRIRSRTSGLNDSQ